MEAAIVINRGKADRASVEEALRTAGIGGEVELVAGDRIEERVRSSRRDPAAH